MLRVDIAIELGAGIKFDLLDVDYEAAGATVSADAVKDADSVIKVKRPEASELSRYRKGALVIAIMDPYGNDVKAMCSTTRCSSLRTSTRNSRRPTSPPFAPGQANIERSTGDT